MILQVITDPDRRGAQIFALDLETELRKQGWAIDTVALGPGSGSDGLPVSVMGPSRTSLRTLRAVTRRARSADVVVGHGSTTLFVGAVAGMLARRPFVYRQISDSHFWASTFARRLRVKAFLKATAAVVALWDESAVTLIDDFGVAPDKVTVVSNGVPVDRVQLNGEARKIAADLRAGLTGGAMVVAYVGALAPEKGVEDLIRALPAGCDRLLLAGTGPDRERLEAIAVTAGRSDQVRFLGSVPDVAPVYAAADLFVFPSRGGDSVPAAVIEAGLAGLPTVVTDSAALPQMVIDGKTGIVVPSADVPALQRAIERLSEDAQLRSAMGMAGRRRCETRFSIEAVAKEWTAVLEAQGVFAKAHSTNSGHGERSDVGGSERGTSAP